MKSMTRMCVGLSALSVCPLPADAGTPTGTAFTYQGQLKQAGVPYYGSADVRFRLIDVSTETPIGDPVIAANVTVVNGLFTSEVDFGADPFGDAALDLEIAVRVPQDPTDTLPFTTLSPRQRLTPTPFANIAKRAQDAAALSAVVDDGLTTAAWAAPSGYLGVGTAEPEVPLDVRAFGGSAGGIPANVEVVARIRGATHHSAISVDADPGFDSILYLAEDGVANWGIRSFPTLDDQFQIRFMRDNAFATRLSIDSAGNVGIGTTAPSAKLHITGTPGVDGLRFPDGSLQTQAAIGDGHSLNASDGDPVAALFVDVDGDVGIGTTTPHLRLTVSSGGMSVFDDAKEGIFLTTDSFHVNRAMNEDPGYEYDGANDLHQFYSEGSPSLTITSAGRVGVGTTTPQDRVHIAGGNLLLGVGSNLSKQDSGGVARALMLYDGSDNLQIVAPPDKTMAFRTGTGGFTSVRATLTAAGRLGIGTATPDVLLHLQSGEVGASATITASNLQLERNNDNWLSFMTPANRLSGLAFSRPGNTATELFHGAIVYNEASLPSAMQFRTGGNVTRMVVDSGGQVGIGTTTPAAKLDVNGTVVVRDPLDADEKVTISGGIVTMNNEDGVVDTVTLTGQSSGKLSLREGDGTTTVDLAAQGTGASFFGGHVVVRDSGGSSTIELSGNSGTIRCVDLIETSTRSMKNGIHPIGNALERILRLQGVEFTWDDCVGGRRDIGLIAEEVAEVFPELVRFDEDGVTATGMNYTHLTALIVEAVKELTKEKNEQLRELRVEKDAQLEVLREEKDAEIAALRAEQERSLRGRDIEIAALKERMTRLEQVLQQTGKGN